MFARMFGGLAIGLSLVVLGAAGVSAGGAKKEPPKVEKKADTFDEKNALVGVIKSVDKKEKSVTLHMEKSKRERTFGLTSNTQYFGPRGGDRNDTGINDECLAPGYELKVVPTKDGRNAAAVMFDVRKEEKKK